MASVFFFHVAQSLCNLNEKGAAFPLATTKIHPHATTNLKKYDIAQKDYESSISKLNLLRKEKHPNAAKTKQMENECQQLKTLYETHSCEAYYSLYTTEEHNHHLLTEHFINWMEAFDAFFVDGQEYMRNFQAQRLIELKEWLAKEQSISLEQEARNRKECIDEWTKKLASLPPSPNLIQPSTKIPHTESSTPHSQIQTLVPFFAVPYLDLVQRVPLIDQVPQVLEKAILHIEQHGLDEQGIFRISPSKTQLENVKDMINSGQGVLWTNFEIHTCAGILKLFLRQMPEPLLTFRLYPEFMGVMDLELPSKRVKKLHLLIQRIPQCNRFLLKRLLRMLSNVAANSSQNMMTPLNLAIVLCPSMLYPAEVDILTMIDDLKRANQLMEFMIQQGEDLVLASADKDRLSTELPDREQVLNSIKSPIEDQTLNSSLCDCLPIAHLPHPGQTPEPLQNLPISTKPLCDINQSRRNVGLPTVRRRFHTTSRSSLNDGDMANDSADNSSRPKGIRGLPINFPLPSAPSNNSTTSNKSSPSNPGARIMDRLTNFTTQNQPRANSTAVVNTLPSTDGESVSPSFKEKITSLSSSNDVETIQTTTSSSYGVAVETRPYNSPLTEIGSASKLKNSTPNSKLIISNLGSPQVPPRKPSTISVDNDKRDCEVSPPESTLDATPVLCVPWIRLLLQEMTYCEPLVVDLEELTDAVFRFTLLVFNLTLSFDQYVLQVKSSLKHLIHVTRLIFISINDYLETLDNLRSKHLLNKWCKSIHSSLLLITAQVNQLNSTQVTSLTELKTQVNAYNECCYRFCMLIKAFSVYKLVLDMVLQCIASIKQIAKHLRNADWAETMSAIRQLRQSHSTLVSLVRAQIVEEADHPKRCQLMQNYINNVEDRMREFITSLRDSVERWSAESCCSTPILEQALELLSQQIEFTDAWLSDWTESDKKQELLYLKDAL